MGKRISKIRLWAVIFWLAVWQLGSHGAGPRLSPRKPAAGIPCRRPVPAGAAGCHGCLLADGGLVCRPDLRRVSALHPAGGAAGGAGSVEKRRGGAAGTAGGGYQGGAGGLLYHSGAGMAQQPQPVPVHFGADGVSAGVSERAGGASAARMGSCWRWRGCSGCRFPGGCGTSTCPRLCPISARQFLWDWGFAGKPGRRRRSSACLPVPSGSGCTPPRCISRRRDLFAWTVTIVAVSVLFERLFLILTDWAARKVGG